MSPEPIAVTVPCRSCGAPLRLDLTRLEAHCAYCRGDAALPPETLDRIRRHLAEIARFESEAAAAASEVDYQRQRRRLGWRWLQPLLPLFTGLYVVMGLGIGGGSQFVVIPFLSRYMEKDNAGVIGGVLALSIWGGFVALPLTWRARRRTVALARQEGTVGTVACGGCGASVPVVLGRATVCPSCGAHLVTGESTNRAARELVRKAAVEQQARARAAGDEADRAGASQSEQTVGSMIPVQLFVIVLAIAVSVAVGLLKLILHLRL